MTSISGIRSFFTVLLFSAVSYVLTGQADTAKLGNTLSGKEDSTAIKRHSLYATAGFGSNMIFLGSSISSNNPFYSTGVVYGFKNSFYLSASVSHIQNTVPFIAYYSASADYKHTFNSWFDISAEVSGYSAAASLEQTLFSPFIFANFTAGFDWRLLYTRISGGALFSEKNTGFLQVSNSRYFQTPEFLKGRSFVSFNPGINVLFGEIYTVITQTGDTRFRYDPPFMKVKRYPTPLENTISSKFGAMDFQFSLPVTFSYDKFSLEAEPCYILPAYKKSSNTQIPRGFTFYLSASFRFF